jgi:hypothetical protein
MLRPLSPRARAAALGLLATAAAVPLVLVPQLPATAAAARAASTGFGPGTAVGLPNNASKTVNALLIGVACSGRGYCSAGGSYNDSGGNDQAMVVTESRSKWGRGVEVKLPANAASNPEAEVNGVACTSPGNCVAVGYYQPKVGEDSGFIVSQRRGAWSRAVAAAPLPKGITASWLYAVACPAAGSCAAAGDFYVQKTETTTAVVLAQVRGRWTQEHALPPLAGHAPDMTGIACSRVGDCVADGFYFPTTSVTVTLPIGYDESRGHWGKASAVALPKNATTGEAGFAAATCVLRASCLGAGGYATGTSYYPMSAPVSGGKWRAATEILALPAHAMGADLDGISCASARLCVGAGGYSTSVSNSGAYLVSLVSGRWRDAGGVSLPSNAATPARSFLYAVGCATDGYCAAVGYYDYYESANTARGYAMVTTRG